MSITVSKLATRVKQSRRDGLTHIGSWIAVITREIVRRSRLLQRMEIKRGGPIGDVKFLAIANRTGVVL